MEWFIPHFLSRSSWWVEENVFPEIHWPLYYSEKLDISIGDTENEGRVSCLLGQRKQDLKHVLLKTLQSYHGSRAQSHTNWNYWLGLWASFHNHFTFVLHGNKMSSQSSSILCKEHCPITLQQASYSIWSLSQTSLASVFGGCQICQLFWDGIEWTIGYRCTGYCSVANCSSRLFFCENLGDFLAKIWANI